MKDAFENGIGVKAPNDALRQTPRIADSTADPLLNAGRSNPWHIGVGTRGCGQLELGSPWCPATRVACVMTTHHKKDEVGHPKSGPLIITEQSRPVEAIPPCKGMG
jgi:hypothetical protein